MIRTTQTPWTNNYSGMKILFHGEFFTLINAPLQILDTGLISFII